jgi:hypothetical protein
MDMDMDMDIDTTPTLSFSDYAEMLDIVKHETVQTLFEDTSLQTAFNTKCVEDVQRTIHESGGVHSLLRDAALIKRIVDMQLKLQPIRTATSVPCKTETIHDTPPTDS